MIVDCIYVFQYSGQIFCGAFKQIIFMYILFKCVKESIVCFQMSCWAAQSMDTLTVTLLKKKQIFEVHNMSEYII